MSKQRGSAEKGEYTHYQKTENEDVQLINAKVVNNSSNINNPQCNWRHSQSFTGPKIAFYNM